MMFNQLWTLKTRLLLVEMMRHLLRTENDTLRWLMKVQLQTKKKKLLTSPTFPLF